MDTNCIDVVVTDKIVFLPGGLFENIFKLRFAMFYMLYKFFNQFNSTRILCYRFKTFGNKVI